jgi:hypothetical protein
MKTDKDVANTSGYNQFRLLQRFLEVYVTSKKLAQNNNRRLGLAIWKERVVYLVTPLVFNVRRSVSSPMEYMYDLQFRAFKRIPQGGLTASMVMEYNPRNDPNWLQKAFDLISKARAIIALVVQGIRTIRATIAKVMELVRSALFFVVDLIHAVVELAMLPAQIVRDFQRLVKDAWNDIGGALNLAKQELDAAYGHGAGYSQKEMSRLKDRSQQTGGPIPDPSKSDPSLLDIAFSNPDDFQPFFSALNTDMFTLDTNLQNKIQAEIDRVRKLTPADFSDYRAQTIQAMMDVANLLGVGDTTVDAVYGISEPHVTRTLTTQELNLLQGLNDAADGFALLAMRRPYDQMTSIDYMAGFANSAGIAFVNPISKFAVPFPYEGTLEQLASQYLGDPDRWMEIATINGLRDPFVDEVGFDVMLTASGVDRRVLVADVTNLRIRQAVWIGSSFLQREKRHIVAINKIAENSYQITLDGDPDLSRFTFAADAYLHAFLPDTVNSMQSVYIPSQDPGVTTDEITRVPGVDAFDPLLKAGGIDLLVNSKNDLVITSDGDCKLTYGLSAIQQRVKLTLMTDRGSLIRHPTFGFPIKAGKSIADMSADQMADSIRGMFGNDPIFNKLSNINVSVTGPTALVTMGLVVFGEDRPIDVTVTVTR